MESYLHNIGRITRRKYLVFFTIYYLSNILSLLLIYEGFVRDNILLIVAFGIVLIATIILLLLDAIRRLHDIGMKWTYALYLLIPPPINFIGFIWLAVKPGQDGENEYGPDPLKTDVV
jgi:uncharacterized membrane protein YhaH (DUF805 family)